MRLRPKVLVTSLPGLMHLQVKGTDAFLRRAWRVDDRGIDDRAFEEPLPRADKVMVDQGKNYFGRPMGLKQVPEIQKEYSKIFLLHRHGYGVPSWRRTRLCQN